MDIQQLRYFLVVSRTCNFTKAANELFISRQAVAQAIHQLENRLGAPLFKNERNILALTPLGEIFQTEAEKIVQQFNCFESEMKKYAEGQSNHLKMAVGAGIIMHLTPEVFTAFSTSFPNILLSAKETDNCAMIDQLRNGEIDLGLIGSCPQYLPHFKTTLIRKSDLCICVNTDNPLAEKEVLSIFDLKGQPIVGHGEDYHLHRFYVEQCSKAGFQPTFSMISTDGTMAWNLVLSNQSLCFGFSEEKVPALVENGKVKIIPFQWDEKDEWGIYAIFQEQKNRSISQKLFINFLLQSNQKQSATNCY